MNATPLPGQPDIAAVAKAAAGEVADLEREANRIGPYIPLAAYPAPLQELSQATVFLCNGLYRTADLAAGVIGPGPAPGLDAVPGKLAVASTRAGHAADLIGGAFSAVKRDLRAAGTAPDMSPSPLRNHTAYASQYLARLDDAMARALRAETTGLPDLALAAGHQAAILAAMSRICDRFGYGITEAYERLPRTTTRKITRAAAPFRRASTTLQKASAVTGRAHDALFAEQARPRKPARAGR